MRVLLVVFAVCALAAAIPRPKQEEESKEDNSRDTELFIVPLGREQRRRPNFGGFELTDDLVPPPFEQHPFFRINPWAPAPHEQDEHVDDFMTQMQDMLKEMRKQLTELIHHSHTGGDLPSNESDLGTRIGEDDVPKNKSTSTTKVIDGHVVTVNETTYTSGDDNIGAVFRIKVVEVKPSEIPEGEESEEKTPDDENKSEEEGKTGPPQPEPTTSKSEIEEDKHDDETNEIPNLKQVRRDWSSEIESSFNEIDQPEEYVVDEFKPSKDEFYHTNKENYYDLSGDTRVNDYVADRAESQQLVMIEPDAEIIDTNANKYYYYDRIPQRLQAYPYRY